MDPISQGSLGAALGGSASRADRLRAGLSLALLAGMAPDLDVLIRSSSDPLLFLEYHRQFTHALLFIPVGAFVCAALAHPVARRWLGFGQTFFFCLLGYASHGLLDACTSYGTQLFWPFSEARVAWNMVSVIDPLFTLPMLAALAGAALKRRPSLARLALGWAVLYIATGAVQGWRAERAAMALAGARDHAVDRLMVKPSFGNLLVWKSVYAAQGHYYVDALRLGFDATYFPGESIPRLQVAQALPWLVPGSCQAQDLERFRRFSAGYLALAPGSDHEVVDVRYSMIPNEIDPLWGIRLTPGSPDRHASFLTDRTMTAAQRQTFLQMLTTPGRRLVSAGD